MEVIYSLQNPKVKRWASLLDRKYRDREAAYLIEGVHLVKEAILSGADIEAIVYSEIRGFPEELEHCLANAADAGSRLHIDRIAVSEEILEKCTDTVTPQSVFAAIRKSAITAEQIVASHRSLVLVADGIQDPGNLGTMIRSADAAGASAVLLGKGTVDLYNAKTIRSTMGSIFHLPIAYCELEEVLPIAIESNVQVVAAALQNAVSCYEADFTGDTWFVMGNEGKGVSETLLAKTNITVKIPMPGHAESLNVAMASTVLLFEAMRQRTIVQQKELQ